MNGAPGKVTADHQPDTAAREAPKPRATERAVGHRRATALLSGAGNQAVQRLVADERGADEAARAGTVSGAAGARLHTDERAARMAEALHARAFTVGDDVVFARGALRPGTVAGHELLVHELAHVAQQRVRGRAAVRRSPRHEVLQTCLTPQWAEQLTRLELDETITLLRTHLAQADSTTPDYRTLSTNLSILEQDVRRRDGTFPATLATSPAAAPPANPTAPLSDRITAFKGRVVSAAVQRLLANRRNLALWAVSVQYDLENQDLQELALAQGGGLRAYEELQAERNPRVRELRAQQAFGRNRACTGCHVEVQARAWAHDQPQWGPEWQAPQQRRGGGPAGYTPPSGTAEARLHEMFPDPERTRSSVQHLRSVLTQLGPEGYKVLPGGMLPRLEGGDHAGVRTEILDSIRTRRNDYQELARRVEAGDLDYTHFGPIIRDLLPTADREVQEAIREEMDDNAFWSRVEAVLVGVASLAVLLLIIFPPTTALGIGALGALEIGLGAYGMVRGPEMIETGALYGLATGAHDVLSPEQQQAADTMVMGGVLQVLTGPLSAVSGWSRLASISRGVPGGTTALARVEGAAASQRAPAALPSGVGRTVQAGPYTGTLQADGSVLITVTGRPDLIIVVREGTVTVSQVMAGGGGVRVIGTQPLPGAAAPVLGAGDSSSTALVVAGRGGSPAVTGPNVVPAAPGPSGVPQLPGGPGPVPRLSGPTPVPLLSAGPQTSYSLQQIRNMRGPARWQEAEIWAQEMYGSSGQQHYPVPSRGGPEPITGTGGRFVDAPVSLPGGRTFAGEVKMYGRWRTVEGVPQQQSVPLSEHIRQQVLKDEWLRTNVPGYDPRWLFLDAPPSPELSAFLNQKNITFVIYH